MKRALYGHDAMHARQPMQRSYRCRTKPPSSTLYVASTGQARTHGGSSQWLHRRGRKCFFTVGYVPTTLYGTQVRFTPSGVSYSALQATWQAMQPMQRRVSTTMA